MTGVRSGRADPSMPVTLAGTTVMAVDTPHGQARLHINSTLGSAPAWATVVLGHGAGGGVAAADLAVLATRLPGFGFDVVRVEQPWRVAGRPIAGPPSQLDQAWQHALIALQSCEVAHDRLVVGGRSSGARVAFRTAQAPDVVGVLALAFPLHPPGNPGRSRRHEISGDTRALIVQGGGDPFGRPDEFGSLPAGVTLTVIPGADHSFRVGKRAPITQGEAGQLIVERVLSWLLELRVGESTVSTRR